jgi:hypothetical protein
VAVPVIAELMRVEYTSPGLHGMESRCAQDGPRRRIVAVRQPVIAQDIAIVPEFLDELVGLVGHVRSERDYLEASQEQIAA